MARLVRAYTRHTPVSRGKYRLMVIGERWWAGAYPPTTTTRDGRVLLLDRDSGMSGTVFWLGEYEKAISQVVRGLILEGDTTIDVGANFGWYTTLFAQLCGPRGEVHAFEPLPEAADWLARDVAMNSGVAPVRITRAALGEAPRASVDLHVFAGMTMGETSLAPSLGTVARTVRVPMTTLDAHLDAVGKPAVRLLKVDAEGAEFSIVKGAHELLSGPKPPLWIMEMSVQTSQEFGYHPNEVISLFRRYGSYRFLAIDEVRCELVDLGAGFFEGEIGANVLCVPETVGLPRGLEQVVRPRRLTDFQPRHARESANMVIGEDR